MAESMIAHFATVGRDALADRLDTLTGRGMRTPSGSANWQLPSQGEYFVLLYEYSDHSEFEPEEFRRLCTLLGGQPTSAVCLELRRSKGRAAHEMAANFATVLLREFGGVLQDTSGEEFWSLTDLESGVAEMAASELWPDSRS